MGFIKPNNNSGGSGGGLTPQQESRLNNAYSHAQSNHAPLSAEENVQADWNETDKNSDAYIRNKPAISNNGDINLAVYGTDLSLDNNNTLKLKNSDGEEIGIGVTLPSGGGSGDSVVAYVTQSELNEAILNGTISSSKIYKVDEKFGIEDYFYSIDPTLLQDGVYTLNSDNSITYSNTIPTESELDLSTTTAVGLIYKGCTSLTKFVANFTTTGVLNNLIFVNCDNLQRVHILNCPLASNKNSLLKMIEYLPDRNNKAWGSIIIPSNKDLRLELEVESIEKDWYFGSDILYKPEELAKCQWHIKNTGILDIWESAEYGEGRRVAIADSGLINGALEIDHSRNKGYYNLSNHKGTAENPVPGDGEIKGQVHGNATASVMVGKGNTWYGVAPKSEWVYIKIGDEDGADRKGYQGGIFKIANETCCDIAGASYSGNEINENVRPSSLAMGDLIDFYNGSNKGFFNRSAGNIKCTNTVNPYTVGSTKETMMIGSYFYADTGEGNLLYSYSARRPNVHFVEATGVTAEYGAKAGTYKAFWGTSCSQAVFTGRMLLAINLFIKKYGYKPTKQELVGFLKHRTFRLEYIAGSGTIDQAYQGYGAIDFMTYNENPICDNELDMEWEE